VQFNHPLKRFFSTGLLKAQDPEPQLKDLCVIKRNGWTPKVPLMDQAFARFVLTQQEAESVISNAVHGVEYRAMFAAMFQQNQPF
jgi:hypothetical protein